MTLQWFKQNMAELNMSPKIGPGPYSGVFFCFLLTITAFGGLWNFGKQIILTILRPLLNELCGEKTEGDRFVPEREYDKGDVVSDQNFGYSSVHGSGIASAFSPQRQSHVLKHIVFPNPGFTRKLLLRLNLWCIDFQILHLKHVCT